MSENKKNVKTKSAVRPVKKSSTKEMVLDAITTLNDRNGSSFQAIKKFISGKYENVDIGVYDRHIKLFLKSSLENGTIKKSSGAANSVNGCFKLLTEKKKSKEKVVGKKNSAADKKSKKPRSSSVSSEKSPAKPRKRSLSAPPADKKSKAVVKKVEPKQKAEMKKVVTKKNADANKKKEVVPDKSKGPRSSSVTPKKLTAKSRKRASSAPPEDKKDGKKKPANKEGAKKKPASKEDAKTKEVEAKKTTKRNNKPVKEKKAPKDTKQEVKLTED